MDSRVIYPRAKSYVAYNPIIGLFLRIEDATLNTRIYMAKEKLLSIVEAYIQR